MRQVPPPVHCSRAAFEEFGRCESNVQTRRDMGTKRDTEFVHTVVIGAGQAGLATAYHLAQRGVRFVVLESNQRVSDTWRKRWDSLRLFTPARFDGLVGMP